MYWYPKWQEWMTLDDAAYRKILALDQTIVVRETPPSAVEQWRTLYGQYVGGAACSTP